MTPHNPLMDFRLIYLRAIATSWKEDGVREKLLENFTGYLEHRFHYTLPWRHVTINLVDSKEPTVWEPKHTAGWIGPNDLFLINLPQKPEVPNDELAVALADYYQEFPTLFGRLKQDRVGGKLPTDLGVNSEKFLEFGGVTLRAVALGWDDNDFFNALTDPDLKDATPILSQYFGYNNPWNFNIRFRQSPDFEWDSESAEWNEEKIPATIIEMHYPHKPGGDDRDFSPIALTSYNNTGPEYPFTCG